MHRCQATRLGRSERELLLTRHLIMDCRRNSVTVTIQKLNDGELMGFVESISSGLRNYFNFSDRAPRSEYWYWVLFAVLISLAAAILDGVIGAASSKPFHFIAGLVVFVPSIAVSVRRLHDLDSTGWWLLLVFTGIGDILLLAWDCMKGTDGPNRFGPDPLVGKV